MWIVRLALRRPYTFVVAALVLLLLTPFVLLRTPTDIFPSINIPVISVIWQYAGLDAQVRLADTNPEPVLTLLSNAVFFRSDGAQAAVLGKDNRASLRKLILGRDFGPTIEVLSGVTKEDRVIVNPPDSLVEGTEVRSVELKPGAR